MKLFYALILFFFISGNAFSQASLHLNFKHQLPPDSLITVTKWRYYISHLKLFSGAKSSDNSGIFLVDAFLDSSIIVTVPKGKYLGLQFAVGIDSITNAKGIQEGSLDPMNGMYWTWNTGYINWKVEGRIKRTEKFERITHHLGGFLPPNYVIQYVKIPFEKGRKFKNGKDYILNITVSLEKYLERSKGILHVMEPGKNALLLSENIPGIFSFGNLNKY